MEEQTEQTGADEASGERGSAGDGGAKATLESRSTGVGGGGSASGDEESRERAGNVIEATNALKAAMKPARGARDAKKAARTGVVVKDGEGRAKAETSGKTRRPGVDVVRVAEAHDMWWLGGKGYFMRSPVGRFGTKGMTKREGRNAKVGNGEGARCAVHGEERGKFMALNNSQLEGWLELLGLWNGEKNKPGEVQEMKAYLQACRQVDGVLNIAGHRDGVMTMPGGEVVLVQRGPKLPVPVKGEWGTIRDLLEQGMDRRVEGPEVPRGWKLWVKGDAVKRGVEVWEALVESRTLADDDGEESWWYRGTLPFYAWLKLRMELLWRRIVEGEDDLRRNAPVMVLIGPPDSYKSFIGEMVMAVLFGGRTAEPTRYLSGETNFNGDLIAAELLVLGDSPLGTAESERRKLGEYFKQAVGQQSHRLEMKGLDAYGRVQPVWSYFWTLNRDKNNLQQMPPMVEGVADKFVVINMNEVVVRDAKGNVLNTEDLDEYTAFGRRVAAEVPAFLHFLLHEFEIPAALKGGRWGMVSVQSPEIMEEMYEDSREGQLLEYIDAARWEVGTEKKDLWQWVWRRTDDEYGRVDEKTPDCWRGTVRELMAALKDSSCNVHQEVEGMFKKGGRPDMLVAHLARQLPDRWRRPGAKGDGRVHAGCAKTKRMWELWRAGVKPGTVGEAGAGAGTPAAGNAKDRGGEMEDVDF